MKNSNSSAFTEPAETKIPIVGREILLPFLLLTTLFAWWGLANNMTDTLLPAFKRIMSFGDSKTAWIQIVCYLFGYGCFAIPGAVFMMKYTYKSGVLLGLGMFITGTLAFFPAKYLYATPDLCYMIYLAAILVTFGGLAILETACNAYICAMGSPKTAVRRLNLSQSFNPLGSLIGIVVSQMFILSQLSPLTAPERAAMEPAQLAQVQSGELSAISATYAVIGLILAATWAAIFVTRMPDAAEKAEKIDFLGTWRRLLSNKNYLWSVLAQFCCVGASIGCWSFTVRYSMWALNLENAALQGPEILRNVEPLSCGFYRFAEFAGLSGFVPRTAEQAGATFYVFSQILFIACRFGCTGLMKFLRPSTLLALLSAVAVGCCVVTAVSSGSTGVYALIGISGCLSLMFPTIFGFGTRGLGRDTKMGGAGMVATLCGGAIFAWVQGCISDASGSIATAYFVPMTAFIVITIYALYVARRLDRSEKSAE